MSGSTRDTVVWWVQARARRDTTRLAALTAADARWKSPATGTTVGRDAVVRNVEEAYAETDRFESEILAVECRGDRAVVVLHNTGRRGDEELDSLQTLFLRVLDGVVADVKVAVDDEEAVEEFWDEAGT
jgi:hypothetical protein